MTLPTKLNTSFAFGNLEGIAKAPEWYWSTKERLSEAELLTGLLDFGLFADKVPPCFTSKGLAAIASEVMSNIFAEPDENKLRDNVNKRAHDYIRYEALRDINIPRHFGIPHPEAYAVQSLAISHHWREVSTHCNQPKPAISQIHVRPTGSGSIFEMNYRGDERYQLEEDEIRWKAGAQYVVHADVASCFPSIYTHSISWALHGKATSKKSNSITAMAGNLLDRCTQNTRDKQTNGLLIGPHASNIISEIILTKIDAELQAKGHIKIVRYIDDYTFYADDFAEAERFIKDLGLCLRDFEMTLNDKKTCVLPLPRPSAENWVLRLNRFAFPKDTIKSSVVRSFLDLALQCSQDAGKSTPLHYAIKALSGTHDFLKSESKGPRSIDERAKQLYILEAINLALAYPYLAPKLDKYVFEPYGNPSLVETIADFSTALARVGIRKLYPDAIAHALYYALKHNVQMSLRDDEFIEILNLDDCITNVLLLEYSSRHQKEILISAIFKKANEIKTSDKRDKDKQWLFIYQTWTVDDLKGNGQEFLADLKLRGFEFLEIPNI